MKKNEKSAQAIVRCSQKTIRYGLKQKRERKNHEVHLLEVKCPCERKLNSAKCVNNKKNRLTE